MASSLDKYRAVPEESVAAMQSSSLDKYRKPPINNEIEAEIASGEWTSQDSLAGALIFLEGATLGWSDEVGVGLASIALSTTTDEKSFLRLPLIWKGRSVIFFLLFSSMTSNF